VPLLEGAEQGMLLMILKTNSRSIGLQEKSGETWAVQVLLQQTSLESDELPVRANGTNH
jgi:hypothetical protein